MKFIPILLLSFVIVSMPSPAHAQSCNPSDPKSCGTNATCKELVKGGGQFFCTASAVKAGSCSTGTDCPTGQICSSTGSSSSGTCVFPKACSPACSATEQCVSGGCVPKGSASQCTPACSGSQTCVRGTCSSAGTPSAGITGGGGSTGTTGGGGSKGITGSSGGGAQTLKNPLKFDSLPELISAILSGVVQLGAILLVFMLVYVGFLFVVAQGNPEKVSAARSALVWTVIGGLILLGAEAISKVIEATVQSISS